eukprot:6460920-Amphidinium_carterae.1
MDLVTRATLLALSTRCLDRPSSSTAPMRASAGLSSGLVAPTHVSLGGEGHTSRTAPDVIQPFRASHAGRLHRSCPAEYLTSMA